MAVVLKCEDCESGYGRGQLIRTTDTFGATTYQCPACYNVVARSRQASERLTSGERPVGPARPQ